MSSTSGPGLAPQGSAHTQPYRTDCRHRWRSGRSNPRKILRRRSPPRSPRSAAGRSRGCDALRRHCCRCRSEEHTSELQSLMRISYAVFCLKKKKKKTSTHPLKQTHIKEENKTKTKIPYNMHQNYTKIQKQPV